MWLLSRQLRCSSQQDLSPAPASPFFPATCRARERTCFPTRGVCDPDHSRQKLPHLHQLLGRECLVLGTKHLCQQDQSGQVESQLLLVARAMFSWTRQNLFVFGPKATLEISRSAAHVSCCWGSWSCRKSELLVAGPGKKRGLPACAVPRVASGTRSPARAPLWLLPRLWSAVMGGTQSLFLQKRPAYLQEKNSPAP